MASPQDTPFQSLPQPVEEERMEFEALRDPRFQAEVWNRLPLTEAQREEVLTLMKIGG